MNIRVLGLGNVLMSDDAFGPYVARVLEAIYEVPAHVQVVDAGIPGLDVTPCLLDADVVVLVDTVETPGVPGDLHVIRLKDILGDASRPRLSPHDPGIRQALAALNAQGRGPREVLLISVVPEWVATGVSLSRAVRAAIAPAIGLIVTELERHGEAARVRAVPRHPDTWWERGAEVESDRALLAR
jgi:hydrogenase maturation protease